jgi:hypothetical protein
MKLIKKAVYLNWSIIKKTDLIRGFLWPPSCILLISALLDGSIRRVAARNPMRLLQISYQYLSLFYLKDWQTAINHHSISKILLFVFHVEWQKNCFKYNFWVTWSDPSRCDISLLKSKSLIWRLSCLKLFSNISKFCCTCLMLVLRIQKLIYH